MAKHTYRVVTRARDGSLRIRDFDSEEPLLKIHIKVGVDDCSTDLSLRGKPVFRGLVGPMPDGKGVARYESPEVFETLTREWIRAPTKRRRRRSSTKAVEKAAVSSPSERAGAATAKESSDSDSEDESANILPMTLASESESRTESTQAVDAAAVALQAGQAEVADEASRETSAISEATCAESAGESKAAESESESESELQEGAGSKAECPAAEGSGRTTRKTKSGTNVKASQLKGTSKSSTMATSGKQ